MPARQFANRDGSRVAGRRNGEDFAVAIRPAEGKVRGIIKFEGFAHRINNLDVVGFLVQIQRDRKLDLAIRRDGAFVIGLLGGALGFFQRDRQGVVLAAEVDGHTVFVLESLIINPAGEIERAADVGFVNFKVWRIILEDQLPAVIVIFLDFKAAGNADTGIAGVDQFTARRAQLQFLRNSQWIFVFSSICGRAQLSSV